MHICQMSIKLNYQPSCIIAPILNMVSSTTLATRGIIFFAYKITGHENRECISSCESRQNKALDISHAAEQEAKACDEESSKHSV